MFFLYSVYISKHIGNGPIFPAVYDNFNIPCKEHWWAVFLYIQNYYNPTDLVSIQQNIFVVLISVC